MQSFRRFTLISAFLLSIAVVFGPIQASHAATVSLTLTRTVAPILLLDATGSTQHDGGTISLGSTSIGRFVRSLRVVTGITTFQNTAIVTITLIGLGAAPPQSVTLHGTHDFSAGNQIGGIGASSIAGITGFTWSAAPAGITSDVYTLILNLP
jgi:hypothetical protein